jgi:hypothetical protein
MDELLSGFTLADIVKMQNEKNGGSEASMYHI